MLLCVGRSTQEVTGFGFCGSVGYGVGFGVAGGVYPSLRRMWKDASGHQDGAA